MLWSAESSGMCDCQHGITSQKTWIPINLTVWSHVSHIFVGSLLNKSGHAAAKVAFESMMASTAQNRRKTHSELQDKLNAMFMNVRLFEKGIKQFSDKDIQLQLSKYLLKTLCTEITNEIFSYVAQENMIQYDQAKELSPEVRELCMFMHTYTLLPGNMYVMYLKSSALFPYKLFSTSIGVLFGP